MRSISPAFAQHPAEANTIGRMVLSFGEIEYLLSFMASWNSARTDDMLRVLYRIGTTSSRLAAADSILRSVCIEHELIEEYDAAHSALIWCLATRNRYAHCNWAGDKEGLYFVDLQAAAEAETGFEHDWRHVDLPLLMAQESYFLYVIEWLEFIGDEILVRAGSRKSHISPKPQVRLPPPAYNPPSQHVPHWIAEAQKARHLARAAEEESGAQRPTRKRLALETKIAEKRAKQAAHRAKSAAGRKSGNGEPPPQ